MDRRLLRQIRNLFFFESFYSGASTLSKAMKETELELEDMMRFLDEKAKTKGVFGGKFIKKP